MNVDQQLYANALSEYRRWEATALAEELPWLLDPNHPGLAEATAIEPQGLRKLEPRDSYSYLSRWMLNQIIDLHDELSNGYDFEALIRKHDNFGLPNGVDPVAITRSQLSEHTERAYRPGFLFMTKVHRVIPQVATRDGVTTAEGWGQTAVQAVKFGEILASENTNVQSMIGKFFGDDDFLETRNAIALDHQRFRLDEETGITTVMPVEEYVTLMLKRIVAPRPGPGYTTRESCPLLHIRSISDVDEDVFMFNDFWRAFSEAVTNHIYEGVEVDADILTIATETEEIRRVQVETGEYAINKILMDGWDLQALEPILIELAENGIKAAGIYADETGEPKRVKLIH